MSHLPPQRLLMIGLDAAEPRLVEQWIADGTLPHLAELRSRGCYGRLASSADWLAGSPWPTFYTGTSPADHGLYHMMQWSGARMTYLDPDPEVWPLVPFWRRLGEGCRVISVDMPMTFAPEPFDGVEISGWATHDRLAPPASHPQELLEAIEQRFGVPPMDEEVYGPQPAEWFLEARDQLIRATECVADLATSLMEEEPWHLFLAGFGATHRGGHKLWDATGVKGHLGDRQAQELNRALREVYVACDAAVGRLVATADPSCRIMVFSLHGMGPNTTRSEDLLPTMLQRILAPPETGSEAPEKVGLLRRLRQLVPGTWRHAVKKRLPRALQDKLTLFWRTKAIDWSTTRAFSMVADLQGYVRINLKGREAQGLVEPGEPFQKLCTEIADGLESFLDADTDEPLVAEVARSTSLYPDGPRLADLPDLILRWAPSPASAHRAIVSPRYGSISWPTPGTAPAGRSGNHRPEGFVLLGGPDIAAGTDLGPAHIIDLAPSVCALLGVPPPAPMSGRPLWGAALADPDA